MASASPHVRELFLLRDSGWNGRRGAAESIARPTSCMPTSPERRCSKVHEGSLSQGRVGVTSRVCRVGHPVHLGYLEASVLILWISGQHRRSFDAFSSVFRLGQKIQMHCMETRGGDQVCMVQRETPRVEGRSSCSCVLKSSMCGAEPNVSCTIQCSLT